jgi:hypothetical protein
MMSYTVSATWSRHVSSLYYIEHDQRCGAVLSGRITIVAISKSGQLDMCCTVELNCSGMSARLAGGSVTRDHTLDTCEPSYVHGTARSFFIPVVHIPLGAVGYVTAPELSSRRGEADVTWQCRSPPRQGGEVRSCGPRDSAGALLTGRQSPEPWDIWQLRSPSRQGGEVQS